jgi:ubiquinone/menaquinone biosynthesis C-methylase UbiE
VDHRPDPPNGDLLRALDARYTPLAAAGGALSCGRALDVAAPREGETVLDLGCGRGGDVLRAAALVGRGGLAIGVDANAAMLAEARARAEALPRVRFVRADLAAVPLPGGRVDVVVSNCAINHAPDKAAVYREIHRLLRPGGRFAVSDVVSERALPEPVRADPAAWAACYGGAIPEQEYLDAIARAGFAAVRVARRTAPYERGGVSVLSITVEGTR